MTDWNSLLLETFTGHWEDSPIVPINNRRSTEIGTETSSIKGARGRVHLESLTVLITDTRDVLSREGGMRIGFVIVLLLAFNPIVPYLEQLIMVVVVMIIGQLPKEFPVLCNFFLLKRVEPPRFVRRGRDRVSLRSRTIQRFIETCLPGVIFAINTSTRIIP